MLQFLVSIIDAKLFETIDLKCLKSVDIKDANEILSIRRFLQPEKWL